MRPGLSLGIAATIMAAAITLPVSADSVTGNPAADGWTAGGSSLSNGVYVRGSANYAYDTYSATLTVTSGSNLAIADGANSWLVGDTVLGLGGVFDFDGITANEAGWSAFSGDNINSLLSHTTGPKLQAKFGTADSTFSASTVAPHSGNGAGSLETAGMTGAVQVRTSAYFEATDWSANAGNLMELDKPGHIARYDSSAPDADVARLMWTWDSTAGEVASWQILLNVSLLDRLMPSFAGPTPSAGSLSLLTVQDGDNTYTDAMTSIPAAVPLPAAAWAGFALMGGMGLVRKVRGRKQLA